MSLPPEPIPSTRVPHAPLLPIPRWKILAGVSIVALITVAAVIVLWWAGTSGLTGKDLVSARLDALKVGLSLGVGGGGLFALYLAWRRQRSTEADLDNRERALAHQERVAVSVEKDAEARRITDLYGKAVEQLGSDKAPVRLGGLYALERLAQDHETQRQTIVSVWCAYLRMPFSLPPYDEPDQNAEEQVLLDYLDRVQEREVRLTAQRLLTAHLRVSQDKNKSEATFWDDIVIDLTGATLIDFNLSRCHVRQASFRRAIFKGPAFFNSITFIETIGFGRAIFSNYVTFDSTRFLSRAIFEMASFNDHANFSSAEFGANAVFHKAHFAKDADFASVKFSDHANFREANFEGKVHFEAARFTKRAITKAAKFKLEIPEQLQHRSAPSDS
ncbi:MAG TPA: pentapeptide repeat-containing protein [Acidobacteriaceae bacterium]|nr:pentapeptide repeat-containing protein [Acidobacteriaceae bacterium]